MPVIELEHPLIQHKLTQMRRKDSGTKKFRELLEEIAGLMAYEATRDLTTSLAEIETPLTMMKSPVIDGKKLGIIPILRAGLGMLPGFLQLIPNAKVGHIGLYRNEETLQPTEYYCKLPSDLCDRDLFVLDPMLATGGSVLAALESIISRGGDIHSIKLFCLVAAPEGIKAVLERFPELTIIVVRVDDCLNDKGYILPGLGDAGDRIFGTL